ncbi:MAG: methyltransferase domain-containing protein [Nitrosomonadales bacterium]|nr:methyltransferase domain-containing protein [Nitrosomonadales bacterium]
MTGKTHFSSSVFDCMIFADILEHLIDPWQALRQAVEHLKPGGTAIISVPNIRHISSLNSIFLQGTFPRIGRGMFDRTIYAGLPARMHVVCLRIADCTWFHCRPIYVSMISPAPLLTVSLSVTLYVLKSGLG